MNKNLLIVGLTVMVNLLFAQSNGAKPSENGNETKVKQIPWQMISSSDEGVPTSSFRIKKVNDTAKKPELKNPIGDPIGLPLDYLDNDSEKIELKPNVKASFPGGETQFQKYVQSEIQYPISCHDQGVNEIVVLRFIVDSRGKISDIKVIEEAKTCPEFITEAIRILQRSPRWVPGQLNGRFIRSLREINLDISNLKGDEPMNQVGEPFPAESNIGDDSYIGSHSVEPIANPDIQACFPGGEDMFYKYLRNN